MIPSWNGCHHLPECFDSIARQTLKPAETILVDNGSTDDTVAFTRTHYPWVRVLPLSWNSGFAHAVNAGIREARGEFVALLNNDTELAPTWVEALVSAFMANPELGSAACKMVDYFDRGLIDAAGDELTRFGLPYSVGHGKPDRPSYNEQRMIFGACAGAAMYRRALFDAIGVFDEEFVSYYEDVDLSFRAQLAGFKCQYVPTAVCFHKRHATGGLQADYPVIMQGRNITAYFTKDMPLALLLMLAPAFVASRAKWLIQSARGGKGMAAWRGLREGLLVLPKMLRKRRHVQKLRKVSVRYLWSLMRTREDR